ncbi:neuronal PAS domain-containing protein 2-like [Ornithodoros turicata]|uniref:neuronal PAS domain-containing protein 2-like n=1 Tax=Ornithodoros turicata TaxID=34597 RepID=UPI003139B26D
MKRASEQQAQGGQQGGSSRRKMDVAEESDADEKDETKRKSRNLSEKKRRDQFNVLINELCSMVSTTSRKMDKSSVLRSTIAFLRHHNETSEDSDSQDAQDSWKPPFLSNEEFTHLMLESLDGFILILSLNGQIMYTSESVASLLGYLPHDLHNTFILDIVHANNHAAVCDLLSSAMPEPSKPKTDACISLDVYMKRGSLGSSDSTAYEPVNIKGTFLTVSGDGGNLSNPECDSQSCSSVCSPRAMVGSAETTPCFVATVRMQTPQLLRELILCDGSKNEFTSRHSMEWKFLYLDNRAPPIIGYLPFELLGTSGYDYYHVDDLEKVAAGQEALMQTGEGTSCQYRFLTKGQQWIWLQTRYYITYHQWSSKPEFVVCTHTVISYDEDWSGVKAEAMTPSSSQLPGTHVSHHSSRVSSAPSVSSRDESMSPNLSEKSASLAPSTSAALAKRKAQEERVNVSSNRLSLPFPENSCVSKESPSSAQRAPSASVSPFLEPSQPPPTQQTAREPVPEATPPPDVTVSEPPVPYSAAPCHTPLLTLTALQPVAATFNPGSSMVHGGPGAVQMLQTSQPSPVMSTNMGLSEPGHYQEYLRRRHQLLQQQILKQQEELKRVSEQLMLVQFITPTLAAVTATPAPLYTFSVPTSTVTRLAADVPHGLPEQTSPYLLSTPQTQQQTIHQQQMQQQMHQQQMHQQQMQQQFHQQQLQQQQPMHQQPQPTLQRTTTGQLQTAMNTMQPGPMTPVYPLQLPQDQMIFTPSFSTNTDFFFGNTNNGSCQ